MLARRSLPSLVLLSLFGATALVHCGSGDGSVDFVEPAGHDAGAGASSGQSIGQSSGDGGRQLQQEAGTGVCGDAKLALDEECDDGNVDAQDGCTSTCTLEPGWACPVVGLPCVAARCGDGVLAGLEECEPRGDASVGCSATCTIEPGYDCDAVTGACLPVVCGDGIVSRGESCEETEHLPFDGCYLCQLEPACSGGVCQATCGDGQRFATEACDDGNTRDGDGCSKTCTLEQGYACTDVTGAPPPNVPLPVLVRDFIGYGRTAGGSTPHVNFNQLSGPPKAGIVLGQLGADGRPYLDCPNHDCTNNPGYLSTGGRTHNITTEADFDQWYHTTADVNLPVVVTVSLDLQDGGTYLWNSATRTQNAGKAWFDPVGTGGWVAAGKETLAACPDDPTSGGGGARNVSFTSETHFWFEYQGGEHFEFAGDDDTWVFVNGKLAVDLGGLHTPLAGNFTLDGDTDAAGPDTADGTAACHDALRGDLTTDFGLTVGGVYEVVMFQAERNECGSNFEVTLKNFNRPKSTCVSTCGDGIVARDELCDDGKNDGSYGGCAPGCKARGPSCGDGIVQPGQEQCDDGNTVNTDGCSNGCTQRQVN